MKNINFEEGREKKRESKMNANVEQNKLNKDIENQYEPKNDPVPIITFDYELDLFDKYKAIDFVFLIDSTGSMNPYGRGVKNIVKKIMWDLEKFILRFNLDDINVLQFGMVTYKDHSDENKTYLTRKDVNLTHDTNQIINALNKLKFDGGKDEQEALLDGLNTAINDINWRHNSIKFICNILDAPCHGKIYSDNKRDNFENCPYGLDIDKIFSNMQNNGIKYYIIKLNDSMNKMIEEFKKKMYINCFSPKVVYDKSKSSTQN